MRGIKVPCFVEQRNGTWAQNVIPGSRHCRNRCQDISRSAARCKWHVRKWRRVASGANTELISGGGNGGGNSQLGANFSPSPDVCRIRLESQKCVQAWIASFYLEIPIDLIVGLYTRAQAPMKSRLSLSCHLDHADQRGKLGHSCSLQ